MSCAVKLHELIEANNVLEKPTVMANDFLRENPLVYKIILLVNHLFRAAAMVFLMIGLPFSLLANITICFAASLIYRLTVENNCAYKFALPAFAGATAFPMACTALVNMVSGAAFASLSGLAAATIALLPIAAYLSYIVLTVSYDVDYKLGLL